MPYPDPTQSNVCNLIPCCRVLLPRATFSAGKAPRLLCIIEPSASFPTWWKQWRGNRCSGESRHKRRTKAELNAEVENQSSFYEHIRIRVFVIGAQEWKKGWKGKAQRGIAFLPTRSSYEKGYWWWWWWNAAMKNGGVCGNINMYVCTICVPLYHHSHNHRLFHDAYYHKLTDSNHQSEA